MKIIGLYLTRQHCGFESSCRYVSIKSFKVVQSLLGWHQTTEILNMFIIHASLFYIISKGACQRCFDKIAMKIWCVQEALVQIEGNWNGV